MSIQTEKGTFSRYIERSVRFCNKAMNEALIPELHNSDFCFLAEQNKRLLPELHKTYNFGKKGTVVLLASNIFIII